MIAQATGKAQEELDAVEGLLQRLARAFNHEAGGMEAVGREVVNLGHWLRLHPGEPAGELITEWLDEQNHRAPLEG